MLRAEAQGCVEGPPSPLQLLPDDETECLLPQGLQGWPVRWKSVLGASWWYAYGMPDVVWADSTDAQQEKAIVAALGGARLYSTNVQFKGDRRTSRKQGHWDAGSTLNMKGEGGVVEMARQLRAEWHLGGDRALAIEKYLMPTGREPLPARSAEVAEHCTHVSAELRRLAPVGQFAKGIIEVAHSEGKTGFRVKLWTNVNSYMELGQRFPTGECALAFGALACTRIAQDGYSISKLLCRPTQSSGMLERGLSFRQVMLQQVAAALPGTTTHEHRLGLCSRTVYIKMRLTLRGQGTFVEALEYERPAVAALCFDGEVKLAIAMCEHFKCVGPPGSQHCCPHEAHRSALGYDWHDRWKRMEYDHGPIAEMKDISNGLSGMFSAQGASLDLLNRPLFLHIMYALEWAPLQAEDGRTIDVCPNLAPRCSVSAAKRCGTPGDLPQGTGCHTHLGRGWASELLASRALLPGMVMLPLAPAVLRSSSQGAGILSKEAVAYLTQRNQVWTVLCAVAAPGALAFTTTETHTTTTADPLAKLCCAALILHLQQSAMLDVANLVSILLVLASIALTGSVLLNTPRRGLLYLCYRMDALSYVIGAVLSRSTDSYAELSFLLVATGRPRLAMLCYLTAVQIQLGSISQQPWEVLLPAVLLRIMIKAATSKCLAWLVRYCSTLLAPLRYHPPHRTAPHLALSTLRAHAL